MKIFAIITLTLLLATGCDNDSSGQYLDYSNHSSSGSFYKSEPDESLEPENPYSSYEEGHYAGYEWAEENDIDYCDGNSNSFIEGCEEYISQRDDFERQQEIDEGWENEPDY